MGKSKEIANKVLYAIMFVVLIPVILIVWAKFTRNTVTLDIPVNLLTRYILLVTGVILICSGIWNLCRSDKRSALNADKPEKFVKYGIYKFSRQPICAGVALISFGLSAVTRSASGFWLVSPVLVLLMTTYGAVFKNGRTQSVLRDRDYKPFLSLPSASHIMPTFGDRLSSYFLVFLPWLIIYKAFIFIGAPDDAISTNLPFERNFPIWEFTTVFYSFAFLYSLLVPLVVKTRIQLKHFITDVWFTIIFVGIIYLVFPLVIKQKDFIPQSFFGRIILYERSVDGESGALPSCHVIWAFLSARCFSRSFVRLKLLWYGLAVIISVSCITVGAHSVLDVVAGFCAFIIVIYRQRIWNYLRLNAVRISDSRKEWRIGPLRIISHSYYLGISGFTGALLAGFFLGRQYAMLGCLILIFVIIAFILLTQLVETSLKLLRPIIFYAILISGIIACILVSLIFSVDIFILLASFAMAAPWVHAIAPLISLHPADFYQVGISVLTGLVLIRLFNIGFSSSFIVGIYLIFTGTGRFVKESLGSEARTPYLEGMKVPQWIAMFYVLSGIISTAIPGRAVLVFQPNFLSLILATGIGILVSVVSGMVFRESNRHLARPVTNFFI